MGRKRSCIQFKNEEKITLALRKTNKVYEVIRIADED